MKAADKGEKSVCEKWQLGVQSQNAISNENPAEGFTMLRRAGFSSVDFSLHGYLLNLDIYQGRLNDFFDGSSAQIR